jgi:hypothetical protein
VKSLEDIRDFKDAIQDLHSPPGNRKMELISINDGKNMNRKYEKRKTIKKIKRTQ